jgi:hypothetical protein
VRKGSTTGTLVINKTTSDSQYQPTTPLTGGGTKYYWHVRACNGTRCSAWTGYWNFTVTAARAETNIWKRDDWMFEALPVVARR